MEKEWNRDMFIAPYADRSYKRTTRFVEAGIEREIPVEKREPATSSTNDGQNLWRARMLNQKT